MRTAILPWLVAGTFFMELLDGTVIATALPQMGQSFGVGPADLSIGMTAYLLTLAVFIPVSGWVADRFGARAVFGGAIVLFTLSSVACGASVELWQFVAARMVQGLAGAMMTPVGRMVVIRATPKHRLVQAISTITWPGLLAPVLGPPVGGFITTFLTWRWIFWLNLPLGLLALGMVLTFVSDERGTARPFDRVGFFLSGAALAGIMGGLDELGRPGASLVWAAVILVVSAGLAVAAVRHANKHPHPMLDLSASRVPTLRVNLLWGGFFRVGFNTIPFLMPLLLQVGFGMSAFDAGLLILYGAAADLASKFMLPTLYRRVGFRRVLVANGTLGALTLAAFALLRPSTPDWGIVAAMLVHGFSRSVQFGALNTLSFVDVAPSQTGPASTLVSMLNQMSTGLGIGFAAVLVHALAWGGGGDASRPDLWVFRAAFVIASLLPLMAVPFYARLPRDAGASIFLPKPG